MRNNVNTTDGFVVRRRPAHSAGPGRPALESQGLPKHFLDNKLTDADKNLPMVQRRQAESMDSSALSSATDDNGDIKGFNLNVDKHEGQEPGKKAKLPKEKRKLPVKKIIKWSAISLLAIVLIFGGYFVYKFIATGGQIFKGNLVNAVFAPAKKLAADSNGRSNVLLFGTSEDDPDHAGADLTDSMMVVSANQDTKEAFLVSIPRDLYVDYGRGCPAGYQGRLNALYSCVKESENEEAGQEALRKKVGEILGLDIQYAAHINYAALREAVDAVGGITVTIDSKDSRGILDRNFDWDCPRGRYSCYNVKYPNGPVNLDGKHALYLARARGANGDTYGLPQANFDREKYQRAILIALKDKAVSAGTLANPITINNLLDTLGKNVRTNFSVEEIKTLVDLAQKIDSANIVSMPLNDPEAPLVTTGNVNGQSIVKPTKSLYDYSEIQKTIKAYSSNDKSQLEKATVDVFNATTTSGVATTKADALEDEGLIIGKVANAPTNLNTAPVQVYDLSGNKKPATRQKLEKLLGITVKDQPDGGITGISSSADFVVIIGSPAQ